MQFITNADEFFLQVVLSAGEDGHTKEADIREENSRTYVDCYCYISMLISIVSSLV